MAYLSNKIEVLIFWFKGISKRLSVLMIVECMLLSGAFLSAQTKRALLIGVGNYPAGGGWSSLSSLNDLALTKKILTEKGFLPDDILELSDDKATKAGILKALVTDLLSQVRPSDIVYFHFSGHGQQKQDFEGDEVDGYDECIVPYDSPRRFQEGVYEGENLLTDDELGDGLNKIRKKIGPGGQLVVVLDACHSGSGVRGMGRARGTFEVMAAPDFILKNEVLSQRPENNALNSGNGSSIDLCPMVAFFGAAQNQLNYEMVTSSGEHYGSLSYALAKHLGASGRDDTYRGLFDKVRLEMSVLAPNQTPQSEGDLDVQIANGRLLARPDNFRVLRVISDSELVIRGGEVMGVCQGSEVGLFPVETRNWEKSSPWARGVVVKASMLESLIRLEEPLPAEKIMTAWVFMTRKSEAEMVVTMRIEMADTALEGMVRKELFSKACLQENEDRPRLSLLQSRSSEKIFLVTGDGFALDSFVSRGNADGHLLAVKIDRSVRNFIRGECVRKMESSGNDIRVEFRIIPQDSLMENMSAEEMKCLKADAGGVKKLEIGKRFMLLFHNKGIKPAYFALLDLQPDNVFTQMIPRGAMVSEETRILPDQKILFPLTFTIGPPAGQEVFKLVASDKPFDLQMLGETRGMVDAGPLERFFTGLDGGEDALSRGGKSSGARFSDVDIFSDAFLIVKKMP